LSRKNKVVWINQGWQPTAVGFVPSKKAWEREMKRQNNEDQDSWPFDSKPSAGQASWMKNEDGESIVLIALNERIIGEDPVTLILTIVHECSHAADWLFEHAGMEPCTEVRAYTIENLVRGVLSAYSKTLGLGRSWNPS
jgi:hypothetical protein